ncbi:MAG: hypothetical protein ACE5F7_01385, partial [Nitrospiria bacterium]
DKRSWRTLPGRIYLGRVMLPEGEWSAEVRFLGARGEPVTTRRFAHLNITRGKKQFLIAHTAR